MSKELAIQAREDRNAALVESMLLAAMADGKVTSVEMKALLRRVVERPEFEGMKIEDLTKLVEICADRLAEAKTLEEILASLRDRLPDHRNRMLAFGLATSVALADRRATKNELGVLKTIQAALGISEEEVANLVSMIEKGGSISEALGEPIERLYAEVMVMMTAADGKVKEQEGKALVESFASDPIFGNISGERAQTYVADAVAALTQDGLGTRLQALARGLTTHTQRMRAYRLGVKIAFATGKPSDHEVKLLDLLQATFGLADDEVQRVREEAH